MSFETLLLLVASALVVAAVVPAVVRAIRRPPRIAELVGSLHDETTIGPDGSVRSLQAADLRMPAGALDDIWSPMHLERLARTYWRFLTRATLGLIRISYSDRERNVVLLTRPFVLLSFHAPDYEMDRDRGIVRWRIRKGVLVSRRGRERDGYLEIEVRRGAQEADGTAIVHVEVEVANFYPSIASAIARWAYANTQSRIHVIVTHGFLRSLARLDLAESRVGRFAAPSTPDAVPDPSRSRRAPRSA